MARGSQKWKGNCALLVRAPARIRSRAVRYQGLFLISSPEVSTTSRSKLPTMRPSTTTPASRHSPPAAVTVSAIRAPSRAAALWCQ
ncbi:hypothetical protein D3C72_405270 [compost metagenome]